MADIIEFRLRRVEADDDFEIDLMTAVDAAIRDLREISARWGEDGARAQAGECLAMLERAFAAAQ